MNAAPDFDYSVHYLKLSDPRHQVSMALARRSFATLAPHLAERKDLRILEIGPGNGLTLDVLRADGYNNVEGWEVDDTLARQAAEAGRPVIHVAVDGINARLLEQAEQWDVVFFMHVLEHVEVSGQLAFLRAVREALRPGGKVICEVPNADSPVAMHYRYSDWTHTCLFNIDSLDFVLSSAQYRDIQLSAALPSVVTPRGKLMDILLHAVKFVVEGLSQGIQKLHLVAGFGLEGLKLPTSFAIVGVGTK
jgi:SAM-dependent methyltransferase